jgi:hypothetical protein
MSDYRDVPLVLRHPAAVRAGYAAMAVAFSLLFLLALTADDPIAPALTGLLAAAVLHSAYATFRDRVVLRRGELLVVNAWKTHRLVPADVAGFSFRPPAYRSPSRTRAELRTGGRVTLSGLGWQPPQLRLLEEWCSTENYWQPLW